MPSHSDIGIVPHAFFAVVPNHAQTQWREFNRRQMPHRSLSVVIPAVETATQRFDGSVHELKSQIEPEEIGEAFTQCGSRLYVLPDGAQLTVALKLNLSCPEPHP